LRPVPPAIGRGTVPTARVPLLGCKAAHSRPRLAAGDRQHGRWDEPPKAWDEDSSNRAVEHSTEAVADWRAEFGFAKRQHSIAVIGYTDDELLEWRKPFDELAKDDKIEFSAFENFVKRKYSDAMSDADLESKVQFLWRMFDKDHSNFIDFGEFIAVGLAFDVAAAKESIRKAAGGPEAVFEEYAEDGFMAEPHFFQLMCDFRFFVATATDVRKLIQHADEDRDGLVSLSDFVRWVESPAFELERETKRRSDKVRSVPLPPPEPLDDEDFAASAPSASMRSAKRRGVPKPPPEPED